MIGKLAQYVRNGEVFKAINVTKGELRKFLELYPFVSVSEHDEALVDGISDDEFAGAVFCARCEDVKLVHNEAKFGNVTPDCWFVNKGYLKRTYKTLNDTFKFGEAAELAMKYSYLMARAGWNGNRSCKSDEAFELRMYVVYVPASEVVIKEDTPYGKAGLAGKKVKINGHFDLKTPDGSVQPGWVASQADIQADDWMIFKIKSNN